MHAVYILISEQDLSHIVEPALAPNAWGARSPLPKRKKT